MIWPIHKLCRLHLSSRPMKMAHPDSDTHFTTTTTTKRRYPLLVSRSYSPVSPKGHSTTPTQGQAQQQLYYAWQITEFVENQPKVAGWIRDWLLSKNILKSLYFPNYGNINDWFQEPTPETRWATWKCHRWRHICQRGHPRRYFHMEKENLKCKWWCNYIRRYSTTS